jgi:hypothetical protein
MLERLRWWWKPAANESTARRPPAPQNAPPERRDRIAQVQWLRTESRRGYLLDRPQGKITR